MAAPRKTFFDILFFCVCILFADAATANRKVPDGFIWGASSSAYQIEGAWNEDGRGKSIWDTFSQTPGYTPNNANGNKAADSYHKYKEDVQMLKDLGVNSYHFSVSWPRVLPDGTKASLNHVGLDYYNNLTDELVRNKIRPVVALYHFDLPQALHDWGGWKNTSTVDHFVDFATIMFAALGDKVKDWITFDEPRDFVWYGYGVGYWAPGLREPGDTPYIVGHNLIRAHVRTYRKYQTDFKTNQKGRVGVNLNAAWREPNSTSDLDVAAAERAQQFFTGWFAQPLFGNGDYPDVMKTAVAAKSTGTSRLPEFTDAEKRENRGAADFMGITYATTRMVAHKESPTSPSYVNDQDILEIVDSSWTGSDVSLWLKVVPWGLRRVLNWIKARYNNPEVMVVENGFSDCGTIYDQDRIDYLRSHIDEMIGAIHSDNCNVTGYMVYNFMDGFGWSSGYSAKFGLYHVDFGDDHRARVPKASAQFYKTVIKNNGTGFTYPAHFVDISIREKSDFLGANFPEGFHWGAATAAFQIEGGWNADGKGPSIWDTFAHTNLLANNATGDVACDSYHKYKEDVQMLKNLGVSHYRFSIAWSRVLPDGTLRTMNYKGIQYYNNLINELVANDIEPMATLYHWDLPQALQDIGGWENETIVDYFNDYARLCFAQFGDRVKLWLTFNEAFVVSWLGYGIAVFAPGVYKPGDGVYTVAHHIIKSHVKAYHTYHEHFADKYNGKVGITLDCDWKEPLKSAALDRYAAERALQFKLGWFAQPIFGNGDYPAVMKQYVGKASRAANLPKSRLPEFTEEEKKYNKGSYDFFGLNHYTTQYVQHSPNGWQSYEGDQDLRTVVDDCWPKSRSDWLRVNPWGLRSLLRWIRDQYGNPPLYVTENGISDDGTLADENRIDFYRSYTNEMLKAIKRDNCDVRGYMAWSLMDNLEWTSGYTQKFGLYQVDFDSPNRTRTAKHSVEFYKNLIKNNGFD